MAVSFTAVSAGDLESLADLRVAAMRESLERMDRFDPVRARERLRKSFQPAATWWIARDGERVGFYALREAGDTLSLDHLYLVPGAQGQGIGGKVLDHLKAEATGRQRPIVVGALRQSASNAFYLKQGFTCFAEEAWDLYYRWVPPALAG